MFVTKPENNTNNIISSGMFKEYQEVDSKPIGMTTGFNCFDIPTAYEELDNNTGLIIPNGGIYPKYYTVIAESGTGKTTMCIQIAGAIADRYSGGNMVFINAEGNTTPDRIMRLNHWTPKHFVNKCLFIPSNVDTSIVDIYNLILKIGHSKKAVKKDILIDTPYRDIYTGKNMKIYPPTVMVIDSIPALVEGENDVIDTKKGYDKVEKLSQNIDAMRNAKANTDFLNKAKSKLEEFNISILAINHLKKDVPMSMFDKPKKYHPNLKAGEFVPGGKEQLFQSFGMMKFTPKNPLNEYHPDYGTDIRGSIVEFEMIKNKASVSGSTYRIVFDKRTGYRPELSDFEYLNSIKFGISGSPMSLYLTILPEIKFTRKTLFTKCKQYPILSRALSFVTKYILSNRLIVEKRFGDLDLDKFANLPMYTRTSIIMGMTTPYPGYVNGDFFGKDAASELLMNGLRGEMFSGVNPNEYISPSNVNLIKSITDYNSRGFTYTDKWEDSIDVNRFPKA